MPSRPSRSLAAVALATGLLSVTACGSSDSGAGASSSSAAGSSTTTSAASPTSASPSSADGHGGHGGHTPAPSVATDGPKPSQASVVAGLQKYYQGIAKATGVPERRYDPLAACVVNKLYPKLSVQSANALKAGALTRLSVDNAPEVSQTTADCGQGIPDAGSGSPAPSSS